MDKQQATRAVLALADERSARRIADILSEAFDNGETAVAAFESTDGGWDITMHFGAPPDEAVVRQLIALASDEATAAKVRFEAVEAKDWVKASLEGLQPVEAGRFVVHGSHDRHRVAGNRIGIEIEAALAFGTGHHGTTRGCLTLLDEVLRTQPAATRARSRHRHRRAGDRRGKGVAPAHSRERHRPPRGDHGARQCAAERRRQSRAGDLRDRVWRARVQALRAVRSGAGKYPGEPAEAPGDADARAS